MTQFNCWPPMFPPIKATSEKITDYTKTPQSEERNAKYFVAPLALNRHRRATNRATSFIQIERIVR
jgi:hypothetical protein